ncbi:hypothetical protein ACIHDR_45390 [Nocardia sp. NPDC052278]|uniref:hypothetical protein n=1 Tax=unclassified Nocardia TaxID=2637762 RepID=UPI0036BC7E17
MSAPEMVLEYINALKWPVVGLAVSFWLRNSITGLIGRVESAKFEAAGVSAELEARAAEVAEDMDAASREPANLDPSDQEESPAETVSARDRLVRFAIRFSPSTLGRVSQWVDELRTFASSEAEKDMGLTLHLSPGSYAAQAAASVIVKGVWRRLTRHIAHTYPGQMTDSQPRLWPETPSDLVAGFRDLDRLAAAFEVRPENTTLAAAREYDRAARAWAAAYSHLLRQVLDEVQQVDPEWVRVPPTDGRDGSPPIGDPLVHGISAVSQTAR